MDVGFVYLIENTFDGAYKIGYTKGSVENRLLQLLTGSSQEIKIVHRFQSQHFRKLEKYLHRMFHHRHQRGEWFNLTPEEVEKFIPMCERAEENFNVLVEQGNYFVK